MTPYYSDDRCTIYHGDNLSVLPQLDDCSVDSIVTDPPYGLGFMGKDWDHGVPGVPFWVEALRVAKPGAHLLAFGGSRTYHWLACAIEQAGWEIRDQIMWVYGSGFSKGFNLKREPICDCNAGGNPMSCAHDKQKTKHDVRPLPKADLSASESASKERYESVLASVQQPIARCEPPSYQRGNSKAGGDHDRCEQSSVEGRDIHRARQGLPDGAESDPSTGESERLRVGTHPSSGADARQTVDGIGGSPPQGPRQAEQSAEQLESVCDPPGSLDDGTLLGRGQCPRCGKLKAEYKGYSTQLKPSHEPIVVARKPLTGTVAANVLEHGTGAINVDGCRIGTEVETWPKSRSFAAGISSGYTDGKEKGPTQSTGNAPSGRFPANLIHDGSDEVTGLFPETTSGGGDRRGKASIFGGNGDSDVERTFDASTGSAARFFYTAKADKSERRSSKHPTVKPLDLMRYLVRLVTPAGGVVLDQFCGSGTTLEAAMREHCKAIGIDLSEEFCRDTIKRLKQQTFAFTD